MYIECGRDVGRPAEAGHLQDARDGTNVWGYPPITRSSNDRGGGESKMEGVMEGISQSRRQRSDYALFGEGGTTQPGRRSYETDGGCI